MTDPLAALRHQLEQLEARHAGGELGAEDYQARRAALERKLLDHVLARPPAAAAAASTGVSAPARGASNPGPAGSAPPRPSWRMTALLGLVVLVIAGAGYSITGSPALLTGPVPTESAAAASPHEMSGEQFAAAVDSLAQKLQSQPDNGEGWAMLARSYMQLGRFDEALPAFAKAAQALGEDARLLADWADALAVKNNRSLDGAPMQLVERALRADPDNLKALALAGTAAFNRKDYAGAVRHWERMAKVAPPDSPWRGQLDTSIAEARQLGGLGPAAAAAAPATGPAGRAPAPGPTPAAANAAAAAAPAASAPSTVLRGTVRLAASVAAQARPEDTVFVFARPAEGSRMPLAIVRKQVKDLPFDFALDDAMAMAPAMKLSLFPKVVVDARVSRTGQAQPSAGDLAGRSAAIAHDASGVLVEINEVVRP